MKRALSGEVQSNRRYFSYAQAAAAEGHRDLAAQLRTTAEEAASHAFGHLDHLFADHSAKAVRPAGTTADELISATAEMSDGTAAMYAGMARTVHGGGFDDVADWFEILATADHSNSRRRRPMFEME
jgi:rubrerythrin